MNKSRITLTLLETGIHKGLPVVSLQTASYSHIEWVLTAQQHMKSHLQQEYPENTYIRRRETVEKLLVVFCLYRVPVSA